MKLSTLSPLRYPGGKSWLTEHIDSWLRQSGAVDHFVEPFAGGANVGLYVLATGLVERLTLVEKDPVLIEFWQAVLDESDLLVNHILCFDATEGNLAEVLMNTGATRSERAFRALVRNRVARGGVLAPRGGILRRGERERGVFSRWYPDTLINRIYCIASLRDQIEFIAGDGLAEIEKRLSSPNTAFLIDPPYSGLGKSAGRRLYSHWEIDHWKLFELCSNLKGNFLLTYEDAIEIEFLAVANDFKATRIPMRNSHHARVFELLIEHKAPYQIV